MIEALCTRCGGTFIPPEVTPEELIHGETEAGTPCGGIGVIQGQWVFQDNAPKTWPETRYLTKMELHGKEAPHCDDPDCEFHHPELIEG